MSEPKTEVTSINVEILGRRLSFTLEEARALRYVLCDALGPVETEPVETEPVELGPFTATIDPYTFTWDGSTLDPTLPDFIS